MNSDVYFRAALAAIIFLTSSIAIFHRMKATRGGDRVSRKDEGYFFATVLRLAGLMLFVVTTAYLVFPAAVHWAMLPIPNSIRWLGVVAGAFSSMLMYWTLQALGGNLTDTVDIRAKATLVTHGPYRWVRHPYYSTTAIVMASVTLLTANWLIGICSLVVLSMLAIRTPKEERALVARFGDQYVAYMAKTGRFFPRFW